MRIKVEFEMEMPKLGKNVTADEIYAWLRYGLHENGSLSLENPLSDYEVEAKRFSVSWREAH